MEQDMKGVLSELLREYPFLLDDRFIRSRTEAEAIYNKGFISCKQVFRRLRDKGVIPLQLWESIAARLNKN